MFLFCTEFPFLPACPDGSRTSKKHRTKQESIDREFYLTGKGKSIMLRTRIPPAGNGL